MGNFQIRTDLALEARESISEAQQELRGVRVEEYYKEEEDIQVTKVMVETKNAAKAMGKPIGTYVTMEAPALVEPDEDYHREISECMAEELYKMLPGNKEEQAILVVGLGNREVTADALGPQVVDNLFITRHVVKTYGKAAYNCKKINIISKGNPKNAKMPLIDLFLLLFKIISLLIKNIYYIFSGFKTPTNGKFL